jgi:tetratricopeptide (TPR) repeat protein/CHAT domain-containing protein
MRIGMMTMPTSVLAAQGAGRLEILCVAAFVSIFLLGVPAARAEVEDETSTLGREVLRLYQEGKYSEALPIAERSLKRTKKALGSDHPATATSLNNLAALYWQKGAYTKATPLLQRALAIREKTLGPDHPDTAVSRNNLGELYQDMGAYTKAARLYERALGVLKKVFGPDDPDTAAALAAALSNLASVYRDMGAYEKAELLYQRAIAVYKKALGPDHPDTAAGLNHLARLYEDKGAYAKAELLLQRALAIRETALGPDHPDTAESLKNLGRLYDDMRAYAKAAPLYKRALAINEKVFGPNHPTTGASLGDLAGVYRGMGAYEKARRFFQRALAIDKKTLGLDHRYTATSLQDLAALYDDTGAYAKAELLYRRALAIYKKALGPDHPDTAKSLNNLALLYEATGAYAKAEPLLQRALAIREKALGPDHPETGLSLNDLGFLLIDLKRSSDALEYARRSERSAAFMLADILSFTSEEQRLEYQRSRAPYNLFASLGDPSGILQTLLAFKGIVLDSVLEDRAVAAESTAPEDVQLLAELRSARQELMQRVLQTPRDLGEAALQRRAAEREELAAEVERREQALARRVAAAGQTRRALRVTSEQVQRVLPDDAVLVELLQYVHYRGKLRSKRRYGAVVLAATGSPRWVPLGSVRAIDARVASYQEAVHRKESEPELRTALAALYREVWAPIERSLPPGTHAVILSPDAALNFVSFATLLTPRDEFLASRYTLRYVASGRDLVRAVRPAEPARGLAIFANPDFAGAPEARSDPGVDHPVAMGRLEQRDLVGLQLAQLPGTAAEAAGLAAEAQQWHWQVERFEGDQATESQLRSTAHPYILHLATHGFFLPDSPLDGNGTGAPDRRGVIPTSRLDWATSGGRPRPAPGAPLKNPMYRSGLALAGAQATLTAWQRGEAPPTETDGIVTAAEVGELDLRGTWLVTLSACDTGTGEARAGEGVLGLRRGFIQAGTQNLLMTLWPVADEQTARFMGDFYAAAQRTGSAPQALAEVQRDWLVRLQREQGLAAAVTVAGPFILSSQGPVQ